MLRAEDTLRIIYKVLDTARLLSSYVTSYSKSEDRCHQNKPAHPVLMLYTHLFLYLCDYRRSQGVTLSRHESYVETHHHPPRRL